jgi:UDP-N-acetylglucosamine 1-carboxyvinyltransferase
MPEKFIIEGGRPLKGEIKARGSKNAATPILAATLLTDEPCIIRNLPLIEDVFRMIDLIKSLGAKVDWIDKDAVRIEAVDIDPNSIDRSLISKMRSSVLIMGPLLARSGSVEINHPGGCVIGTRSLDTHLDGFESLGVVIEVTQIGTQVDLTDVKIFCGYSEKTNLYSLKSKGELGGREIILDEFSVTATENILMASALSEKKTTIRIAACEPHVQELARFLKKMGVEINGEGTHTIEILGKKKLKGADYSIPYDYVEAGTYILMGLTVGGEVRVDNVPVNHLELFFKKLKSFGANVELVSDSSVLVKTSFGMKMNKIQALPYPGIPTDLQSAFGALATKTEGLTLIHDPLYDGRLKYLEELNKMGAEIVICDPHRAVINGPTELYGTELGPLDLRSGAALIIAGLSADGVTIIKNISQVDRGYERIEERLQAIGASIKRVEK